jgi:predicted metalloprotease
MKWKGRIKSENVENQRGTSSGGSFGGGLNPLLIGLLLKLIMSKKRVDYFEYRCGCNVFYWQ